MPNFFNKKFKRNDIRLYNPLEKPFRIHGLMYSRERGQFHRIPFETVEAVSENLEGLNTDTSGGRIRFVSDSAFLALKCVMRIRTIMPHMPQTGTSGFTVYADGVYGGTFIPSLPVPGGADKGYEGLIFLPQKKKQEITLYFPLYNSVDELYLGLEEGALVEGPLSEYTYPKPIVFYGSSITQGGCASRPGNSYDAVICRNLDSDYINVGLSGNCKGEIPMAEYLSTIDASIFVYDYDHNAPNPEYLKKTHYPFYRSFRKKNKEVPIIMISRPDFFDRAKPQCDMEENILRRDIIIASYKKGVAAGDQNLSFIDGETLFGRKNYDNCTVDNCHPNDLGFMRMAEKIEPIVKSILKTKTN